MNEPLDYIEMKIPAKPEYVGIVRLALSGIASRMGYSYDEIEDLKVATSEACTNAVHHAYKKNEEGEVIVGYSLYKDRLEVLVADNGTSFDFQKLKEEIGPYKTCDHLQEGGLGLYLIETLMDDVKFYNNDGVRVSMTKYLSGERTENDSETISTYDA